MNRVFYRYIRYIRFNTNRLEYTTLPNGGICLRFERLIDGDHTLFTYSRCHSDDHFKKSVAKKIADERALNAKSDARLLEAMSPYMKDVGHGAEELCWFLIGHCNTFDPVDYPFLVAHYLSIEWKGFAEALEKIMRHNQRETEKGEIWLAATQTATSKYATYI